MQFQYGNGETSQALGEIRRGGGGGSVSSFWELGTIQGYVDGKSLISYGVKTTSH